ncbi:unnamed protein product [Polarella glacialis]|uniref:Uncharacterized protein n=1 Tax=Polarella glacialis TaxID=89957 RepID=A0A813GG82_POLGL|nr:unnamed protein product [Polarella glacialis]
MISQCLAMYSKAVLRLQQVAQVPGTQTTMICTCRLTQKKQYSMANCWESLQLHQRTQQQPPAVLILGRCARRVDTNVTGNELATRQAIVIAMCSSRQHSHHKCKFNELANNYNNHSNQPANKPMQA